MEDTKSLVRWSTDENIGLLQLAMTITNIFVSIANYNMRVYQASDVQNQYSAGHYIAVRLLTCAFAFLLCIGYSAMWNYSGKTIVCIAVYMVYRITECIADVLYAIDQKHARMDYTLISYSSRGLLALAVFCSVILLVNDLVMAIFSMVLANLAVIVFYDLRCTRHYDSLRPRFEWRKIKGIFIDCFPATLGIVCFSSTVTIPRQNLGIIMGQEMLGYYATVATPLVFVQVLVNSLLYPLLGDIAVAREEKNIKRFWGISRRMLLMILGVGIVAIAGVSVLGRPVMQLLYGEKIIPYVSLMFAVIGCTVLYAVCCVGFNLLIVLRRMKTYLLICAVSLATAVGISKPLIVQYGANGVSLAIMIAYALAAIASFTVIQAITGKWMHKENSDQA